MDNKFEVEVIREGTECLLQIQGSINELTDFPSFDKEGVTKFVFDLERVTFINSSGIREWVIWMRSLTRPGLDVVFRKCPYFVVDQMNILKGFLPENAVIESFDTPYGCDSCDHSVNMRFLLGENYEYGTADRPKKMNPPKPQKCDQCGGEMAMDVVEKKYFKFLDYR